MSKFEDAIRQRLAIIAQMIRSAKQSERRQLQRERSDLEAKLAKVSE